MKREAGFVKELESPVQKADFKDHLKITHLAYSYLDINKL